MPQSGRQAWLRLGLVGVFFPGFHAHILEDHGIFTTRLLEEEMELYAPSG